MKITAQSKKFILWGGVCSILFIATILPGFLLNSSATAASVEECISSSGASSVGSVIAACGGCFSSTSSGGRRGTLWFNDGSTKDSDTVNVATDTGTAPIVMWGQVYSCQQSGAFSNTAHYIWFGESGSQGTYDPHLNFLNFGSTLNRGSGSGAHTWSTGGSMSGTINIEGFLAGASCTDNGDGSRTCERVVSVNRCYSNAYGGYVYDGSVCYGDDSTIRLRIGTPPTSGSATAHFESTSTINVGDNIDNGGADITTTPDGSRSVEFSTDNDYTTVTFKHNIHYDHGSFTMGANDQFTTKDTAGDTAAGSGIADISDSTNIYTPYYITNTENGAATTGATSNTSSFTTSDGTHSAYNNSYNIYVPEGSQKTVCSRVNYTQKNANIGKSKHITRHAAAAVPGNPGTPAVSEVSHNDYYLNSYSDSGSSEVCVTVVHPSKPGGNPQNPNASGTPIANIMFAGENTRLAWNINATGVPTRRLQERNVIGYLVSAGTPYGSYLHTGSYGTNVNPCSHYGSMSTLCHTFSRETANWSDANASDTYNRELGVKVPNEVGTKYCNSAGYKFQYFFAIDGAWQADNRPGRTYWYNFGASCRTIAKKPSVAVWNSGIFTSGSIRTSISDRFDAIGFGESTSDGNTHRTIFGSWSEFLATVGGKIRNNPGDTEFASGSVFYNGSGNSSRNSFYPLTIANNNTETPGYSGISLNPTLNTRLDTYLRQNANAALTSGTIGGTGWTGVRGTIIYNHSGNVTINDNITINSGTYTSIYDIPQVILFVNGDVEITSNVSRIDAWIIATGSINTCNSFASASTVTNPSGQAGAVCANQLVFNGPVMANRLILNRSFGSDPNTSTGYGTFMASSRQAPAEIFNFRADSYLWAYAQSSRYRSSFTETYSRELAPRY